MTNINKSFLEEVAAATTNIDPEEHFRTDYSGRAMFGKECFGLVVSDIGDLLEFVQAAAQVEAEEPDNEDASNFNFRLADVKADGMGMDTIYYWPSIQVVED